MKIYLLIITSILLVSSNVKAQDKFICSSFYAKSKAEKVRHYPGSRDKFKHCSVSCMLTLKCGSLDSFSIGVIKEIFDLLGMGTAEVDDIKANMEGINLAKKKIATDDDECMIECGVIYP
jgi:hypothetical protein